MRIRMKWMRKAITGSTRKRVRIKEVKDRLKVSKGPLEVHPYRIQIATITSKSTESRTRSSTHQVETFTGNLRLPLFLGTLDQIRSWAIADPRYI